MPTKATYTDQEAILLGQLKSGEEKAFDYFYDRYSLPIYRKLLKLVKVDQVAEEILQGLFIRLWEKRRLIDTERPIKYYLHQIAQNMVMDFYRSLAREQRLQLELKYKFPEISRDAEETLIYKQTNELLEEAVSMLPNQQQAVFRLCKLEGKTYDEVGEILGISTSTINSHIVKATKKVKLHLIDSDKFVTFVVALAAMGIIGDEIKNLF